MLETIPAHLNPTEFAEKYGPWAVIAGASDGTGAAFAEQIAATGGNVVLIARRQPELEKLGARLAAQYGVEYRVLVLDLTQPDAAKQILDACEGLDVGLFIMNAGIGDPPGAFVDSDLESCRVAVSLNVEFVMHTMHGFGARLRDRGRGGMLLMSSSAALGGRPYLALYSATKSFGLFLAESLWGELGPEGVDVLGVVAQATATPTMIRRRGGVVPEGLAYRPEDVARVALATLGTKPILVFADAAGNDIPDVIESERRRRLDKNIAWVTEYRKKVADES